jgi:hypothetical protein
LKKQKKLHRLGFFVVFLTTKVKVFVCIHANFCRVRVYIVDCLNYANSVAAKILASGDRLFAVCFEMKMS